MKNLNPNTKNEIIKEFREKFGYKGQGQWFTLNIPVVDENEDQIDSRDGYMIPLSIELWLISKLQEVEEKNDKKWRKHIDDVLPKECYEHIGEKSLAQLKGETK